MKKFDITLSNMAYVVLDYTMVNKYDEPVATINDTSFSWWSIADIRNALALNMDINLSIGDTVLDKENLEELYQFCIKTEKIYDRQLLDEEEKYNGPKED